MKITLPKGATLQNMIERACKLYDFETIDEVVACTVVGEQGVIDLTFHPESDNKTEPTSIMLAFHGVQSQKDSYITDALGIGGFRYGNLFVAADITGTEKYCITSGSVGGVTHYEFACSNMNYLPKFTNLLFNLNIGFQQHGGVIISELQSREFSPTMHSECLSWARKNGLTMFHKVTDSDLHDNYVDAQEHFDGQSSAKIQLVNGPLWALQEDNYAPIDRWLQQYHPLGGDWIAEKCDIMTAQATENQFLQ